MTQSKTSVNHTGEVLKRDVQDYWNGGACGTDVASSDKFSTTYFEEIEEYRYRTEPEIFAFAQFTRFRGKKMLEVGVGAGSDFLQWVRAGARASGIDLTQEAVDHVRHRLACYGLECEDLKVSDAEHLPFPDSNFDLVYSWGVIHHTPNTIKALEEIIRVMRVGGTGKVMVYNRWSPYVVYKYLRWGIGKGKPFKSVKSILDEHQESRGTKAYTIKEMKRILSRYPVRIRNIEAPATYYDLLPDRSPLVRASAYLLACLMGFKSCGWFLQVEFEKTAER